MGSAAPASRQAGQQVSRAGRRAARSPAVEAVGRAGLVARGALYGLIGVLALQVAFGQPGQEADKTGALRAVAGTPAGGVSLWLLAAGFAGLAVWQCVEVTVGGGQGHPTDGGGRAGHGPRAVWRRYRPLAHRLAAAGRAVLYAVLGFSVVRFLTAHGNQPSGDARSQDVTARVLGHGGGPLLVGVVGVVILVAGVVMAVRGLRRDFTEDLDLSRTGPMARRAVVTTGLVGQLARGFVFGAVGVFVLQAALTYDPSRARGLDGSLRGLADTPLGPWLLVFVALGLVTFGAFSIAEAYWHRGPGRG